MTIHMDYLGLQNFDQSERTEFRSLITIMKVKQLKIWYNNGWKCDDHILKNKMYSLKCLGIVLMFIGDLFTILLRVRFDILFLLEFYISHSCIWLAWSEMPRVIRPYCMKLGNFGSFILLRKYGLSQRILINVKSGVFVGGRNGI